MYSGPTADKEVYTGLVASHYCIDARASCRTYVRACLARSHTWNAAGLLVPRSMSADGFGIERSIWSNGAGAEIELIAIDGAVHAFPQPYYRAR